jgi:hypothetical protein
MLKSFENLPRLTKEQFLEGKPFYVLNEMNKNYRLNPPVSSKHVGWISTDHDDCYALVTKVTSTYFCYSKHVFDGLKEGKVPLSNCVPV